MRVDPIQVRVALSSNPRPECGFAVKRRAAVALVLHVGPPETRVLLIRRAERPGDPWSGHMALPGGHAEPQDPDSRATAVRETFEEVGLTLDDHSHLGTLPDAQAWARGRPTGTLITPHVFAVVQPASLRPNHEVAEFFWAAIGPMARGANATKVIERSGQRIQLPAIRVEDHLVWGITYRILSDLLVLLSP